MVIDTAIEDTIKFSITMFSILNPLGAIPIFLNLTREHSCEQVKKISNSTTIAVAVTILSSLLLGQKILDFFGISIPSFTIGGGILIFSMAFSMIHAKRSHAKFNKMEQEETDLREIGIVPLAIPLLSGPGVISSAIIYSKKISTSYHWVGALITIILLSILVKITLRYARVIGDKMGKTGLNVMTRVMGIILLAVSIEMILGGIKEIIPILKG